MNHQNKLGEEKVFKLLLEFSVPAIIGMIVNTLYNIIDRMYIGHIPEVGNLAITGVSITMPIMTIMLAFGMLVGIGTSAKISLKLGQNDKESAEKHLSNAFTLLVIISILITIFGLLFMDKLLAIFGASEQTLVFAREYIEVIFIGTIFNMLSFGLNHSIRSDGNPKIAMCSMLIGAITNIVLDPIFIFTFNMGVRGGAIATVISQIVTTIWVLYYFIKGKSVLKIRKKYLKLDKTIVLSIFAIGISPFSMQIAQSVVQVIANNSLRKYGGDNAIGAMGIISSISMIFLMPVFGINQGSQPIIGFNYGAKKYKRVKETVKYAVSAATVLTVTGFLAVQLIPNVLISMFNSDPDLINIGVRGLRVYLMMFPILGFQIVSSNFFQSIGKAKISMFLSLLRQVIILIPCMIILPMRFELLGVWMSGAVSDLVAAIITGIIFFKAMRNLKEKKELDIQKAYR
ncbi:MATE family efflux transporter [Clostridium senegalense]|uniref:MATE family efflux transporter n=1 Tax=Clostridium senegalense TaxID=1465809 RepID=UPI001C10372B|nr:MATE family efflux transporter [Clostridium senegalense]MBU5228318.1 MATE family efflux transporter [Clostridium senegalense]